MTTTLQQVIDERISFLKEQINPNNKAEVNSTFQLQIDAIRSVNDIEKVELIILEKKAQLKNSKDYYVIYFYRAEKGSIRTIPVSCKISAIIIYVACAFMSH